MGSMALRFVCIGFVCALATGSTVWAGSSLPVIEVSPNSRFLQTTDGTPFFWMGDTAWQLYRLNPAELEQYYSNRSQKGFNVIQGPTLLSDEPNYAGVTNPNHSTPNPQWFAHIDLIIEQAAAHNLYVAPVLAWGTIYDQFTLQSAYDWGFFVGNRYRNHTNIAAFFVASEFNYPAPNTEIWNQVALGIQAGLAGNDRLITAHPRWFGIHGGQTTSEDLHDFPWLAFNTLQSSIYGDCTNDPTHIYYLGTHNWILIENDYALVPVKPVMDAEATYEMFQPGHPFCQFNPPLWEAFGIRRRAYWSVFSGGFGTTYGANGVFQFHKDYDPNVVWNPQDYWDIAIDYPGATDVNHLRALIQSRPFFSRIPGQDFMMSDPGILVPEHIHATRDSAGRYAMVYVPEPGEPITVDMDLLSGASHKAWWFDPSSGQATLFATYSRADYGSDGALNLTTPGTGDDWVLVIDDASQNWPAPAVPFVTPGDVNRDWVVNITDLLAVIGGWGPCTQQCMADLNSSGTVDVVDLLLVINNWS